MPPTLMARIKLSLLDYHHPLVGTAEVPFLEMKNYDGYDLDEKQYNATYKWYRIFSNNMIPVHVHTGKIYHPVREDKGCLLECSVEVDVGGEKFTRIQRRTKYVKDRPQYQDVTRKFCLTKIFAQEGGDRLKRGRNEITLMTYNVLSDSCNDNKSGDHFHPIHRLNIIIKQILEIGASIITIQEAEFHLFKNYVEERLPEYEFYYCMKAQYIVRKHDTHENFLTQVGVATAFLKGKFNFLKEKKINFNTAAQLYKEPKLGILRNWKCDLDNVALILSLELQSNKKVIHVCNVHLKASPSVSKPPPSINYSRIRTFELLEMFKYIKTIAGDNDVVLAGDFNEGPTSALYNSLTKGSLSRSKPEMIELKEKIYDNDDPLICMNSAYKYLSQNCSNNARSQMHLGDQGEMRFTHFQVRTDPITKKEAHSGNTIDYIFYKMSNNIDVLGALSCIPLPPMMPNTRHPSDHLPLAVKFLISD